MQAKESGGRYKYKSRLLSIAAGGVLWGCAGLAPVYAQAYPNKPIRMILPFSPGGSVDLLARIVGPKLTERMGQPVVPDNRPGAGGNIAAEAAAKATPDGYTLLFGSSALAISPSLYKRLRYSPLEDFAPVALIAEIPIVALIRPTLQARTVQEFVSYAKANPGKASYGSSGVGSTTQLANELFNSTTKINLLHVPYKGNTQALVGLMGGEVDMLMVGVAPSIPLIQAGKVRALVVLTGQRLPSLPNVPSAREAGIANSEATTWFGILTPSGTPRSIVQRLNEELVKIVAMPDTTEKFKAAGAEPTTSSPRQFAELLKSDTARWAKVIKEAKIEQID
jgi:tripartite-type tricarboxylate transporter receptor subunit TctC